MWQDLLYQYIPFADMRKSKLNLLHSVNMCTDGKLLFLCDGGAYGIVSHEKLLSWHAPELLVVVSYYFGSCNENCYRKNRTQLLGRVWFIRTLENDE